MQTSLHQSATMRFNQAQKSRFETCTMAEGGSEKKPKDTCSQNIRISAVGDETTRPSKRREESKRRRITGKTKDPQGESTRIRELDCKSQLELDCGTRLGKRSMIASGRSLILKLTCSWCASV